MLSRAAMQMQRHGIWPRQNMRGGCRSAIRHGGQDGFTLIELMTAVFIVVILLAVGTPSFTHFIQNMQIRSVAESMLSGLNLARDEAVKRNSKVTVWLVDGLAAGCLRSRNGNAWVVSLENPVGKCNVQPSESVTPQVLQSRSLSDGSSNVAVEAQADCATFNGFGRLEETCDGQAPLSRIDFRSRVAPATTRALAVSVIAGGAVKLCNPGLAETGKPGDCPVAAKGP